MDLLKRYSIFQHSTEKKNNFDIKYMALGLGGEVGELLNEIKKLERDDNNIVTTSRKEKMLLEMGDILWYLQGLARRLDISIEDMLNANIEKLSSSKSKSNS